MKVYITHDNGAKPFLVKVHSRNKVSVWTMNDEYKEYDGNEKIWKTLHTEVWRGHNSKKRKATKLDPNDESLFPNHIKYYDQKIFEFDVSKVYPGSDDVEGRIGNTVLLKLKADPSMYIYIGESIFKFKFTEPILRYYSDLGNNDVPYPIAESKENIIFMMDKQYTKKSNLVYNDGTKYKDYSDAYTFLYEHDKSFKMKKLTRVKELHKRM